MRDCTEDQMTLALLRHGETKANQERRYLGKTDEPLSEAGRTALERCKEQNIYPEVDYLFCSPMKRCLETAEILYPDRCPIVIPEWEEIDFGRLEYKNAKELQGDAAYQAWIDSGGTLDFPEGESRHAFIRRCESGFVRMCDKLREIAAAGGRPPAFAGLIVHGGTIMALLSLHGEKQYFDYQAANGRGYLCRMTGWGSQARMEELAKL